MNHKKGFTLVEMMLGLLFSSILFSLMALSLTLLLNSKLQLAHFDQNRIGLIQLQNELTVSSDFRIEESNFCYQKFNQDYCLTFDKDRLVKRPGYEIFLINIDDGFYEFTNNEFIIHFKSNQKEIHEKITLP